LPNFAKVGHKRIVGPLVVDGYVGADGAFHDAVIVKSPDKSLEADMLAAVKKWTFKPCSLDGSPVNCRMQMQLDLRLNN
jgi:TonB family protein